MIDARMLVLDGCLHVASAGSWQAEDAFKIV